MKWKRRADHCVKRNWASQAQREGSMWKTICWRRRQFSLWTLAALFASVPWNQPVWAAEGTPPFVLDLAAPQTGGDVRFNVPAQGGAVNFTIFRTTGEAKGKRVRLHISPFATDQGEPLGAAVGLRLMGQPTPETPQTDLPDVPFEQAFLGITLDVPKPPTTANYSGRLSVFSQEKPEGMHWKISVTRAPLTAPQAEILVSPSSLPPIPVTISPFTSLKKEKARFALTLQEKSRLWALHGVTVLLDKVERAPEGGLDLSRNFDFWIDGKRLDLTRSPAKAGEGLTIQEGQQARVEVALKGLRVGEYGATLRFQAPEAADRDTQKVSFSMKVRHHWTYPLVVLIVAVVLAFFTVKGVITRKQRLDFLKRIEQARGNLPPTGDLSLPTVRARALLRQAEDLSRRFWLTAPDEINSRLATVEFLIAFLRQIHEIRQRLAAAPTPLPVTERIETLLHRITVRLGESAPGDEAKTQLSQAVSDLNGWFQSGELEKRYWADLSGRMAVLCAEVDPAVVNGGAVRNALQSLLAQVRGVMTTSPVDLPGKVQADRAYSTLKLLWERRAASEFESLINLHINGQPLESLYEEVNKTAWARLATLGNRLVVTVPQTQGPERLEAYDLLTFRFSTGDPDLDQSYLVQRSLRYEWTITLLPTNEKVKVNPLKPVTTSPSVVQFFPLEGTVRAEVKVTHLTDPVIAVMAQSITLRSSMVFRWVEGFETVEAVAAIMTLILAVTFGLTSQVLNKETFGSSVDYLNLLIWGGGAEGAKRLLQWMQDYSAWPKSP